MKHQRLAALISVALIMTAPRAVTCSQADRANLTTNASQPQALAGASQAQQGETAAARGPSPQSPAQLTAHGEEIRRKVEKIGLGHKITVVIENGDDLYGSVSKIDERTFEMVEVDLKQRVTVNYDDVKKVRSVYGGKGLHGQRTNPRIGYAVVGGLLLFLVIVAVAVGGGG